MVKTISRTALLLILMSLIAVSVYSRTEYDPGSIRITSTKAAGNPFHQVVVHRINKLVLSINNNGTFGTGFLETQARDYFTGDPVPSCEYPRFSRHSYLFAGAFWIGAVVGRDTLVSVAADGLSSIQEFRPHEFPFDTVQKKSIAHPDNPSLFNGAVSEEDYIMTYSDTNTTTIAGNDYFGRPHTPLHIKVTQKSYAWSYPYAEDFILFDYAVENIGVEELKRVYMGIYVDGDVGSLANTGATIYVDDVSGFYETTPTTFNGCEYIDTVNIAWLADNDGDPQASLFNDKSVPSITGTRIIRTPADSLEVSFNWWVSDGSPARDFGPRERSGVGKLKEDVRDYRTGGLGTPEGDVNKYYIMRNREFDYDQPRIGTITQNDTLWLEPPSDLVQEWSQGLDTRYLLSFGPFDIKPGEKLPISFAYVGGENFHSNPDNLSNLPDDPDAFYENLNFRDFGENAAWAARVYDNPGVDTDGDGEFGKFRVCCQDSTFIETLWVYDSILDDTIPELSFEYEFCDTNFYEGDGVPDFKGASPPPPPDFWVTPTAGEVHVRFNGLRSETTRDNFSRIFDFEGYRVYIGRDLIENGFTMVQSYDKENYNKFVWNPSRYPTAGFELRERPYTLDQLKASYGTDFDPNDWSRSAPFIHPSHSDSIFYFEPQDFNVSELGVQTDIRKIYPDQPYPTHLNPDSADASEITEDGYLKFFEYEITIENLLPTVPYYVNITAFDFGSPESGLPALESSLVNGAKMFYALDMTAEEENPQQVYVWPNPYRIDADYQTLRFERPDDNSNIVAEERLRALNFGNLPPKCTIKIFSLDGDLIREIEHDKDPSDATHMQDEWDLITRNTQMIVSGLYYYVVEEPNGNTQIGKFVIIM